MRRNWQQVGFLKPFPIKDAQALHNEINRLLSILFCSYFGLFQMHQPMEYFLLFEVVLKMLSFLLSLKLLSLSLHELFLCFSLLPPLLHALDLLLEGSSIVDSSAHAPRLTKSQRPIDCPKFAAVCSASELQEHCSSTHHFAHRRRQQGIDRCRMLLASCLQQKVLLFPNKWLGQQPVAKWIVVIAVPEMLTEQFLSLSLIKVKNMITSTKPGTEFVRHVMSSCATET